MKTGDIVNMKTFTHTTEQGVTFHIKRASGNQTYVFMYMGIEEKGKPLDLIGVMKSLGWQVVG